MNRLLFRLPIRSKSVCGEVPLFPRCVRVYDWKKNLILLLVILLKACSAFSSEKPLFHQLQPHRQRCPRNLACQYSIFHRQDALGQSKRHSLEAAQTMNGKNFCAIIGLRAKRFTQSGRKLDFIRRLIHAKKSFFPPNGQIWITCRVVTVFICALPDFIIAIGNIINDDCSGSTLFFPPQSLIPSHDRSMETTKGAVQVFVWRFEPYGLCHYTQRTHCRHVRDGLA